MRRCVFSAPGMVLLMVLVGGCGGEATTKQPDAVREPAINELPVSMRVVQRSTTAVPGSGERVLLTVDDVTDGQVIVSLATGDGAVLMPARSMAMGDEARFRFEGHGYVLRLGRLENKLVGDDYAQFEIALGAGEGLSEREKIEKLIEIVASLEGATFIRNEDEHTAAEAAAHMRRKWEAGAERIRTAEQFIEHAASRSSLTGEPYRIKLADGRVVKSADFLHERLRAIEGGG